VPLTAAEEKARLRAQYAAEDQTMNGTGASSSVDTPPRPTTASSIASSAALSRDPSISRGKQKAPPPEVPPVPPPLMPRPPMEYIQETQEQDEMLQKHSASLDSTWSGEAPVLEDAVLDRRFTTTPPNDGTVRPPLPPKVAMRGEHDAPPYY